MAEKLLLVDGSGYIFRAFHALPAMTRPDGTPVNAVYGFASMLMKLVDDVQPDCIAVIFDTSHKTFRSEIYPNYKANRSEPPDELIPQFAIVRAATEALSLPQIEARGFEADDLIATYAKLAEACGLETVIVSSDKDLMQLIRGNISMLDPIKQRRIGADEVLERFGVLPEKVVDVQALAGDPTDNVPGVPGIGVKTAAELINKYGDLETLLDSAEEIKQNKRRETLLNNKDKALISKKLVTLKNDAPIEMDLTDFELKKIDKDKLYKFLREMEFNRLLSSAISAYGKPNFIDEKKETQIKETQEKNKMSNVNKKDLAQLVREVLNENYGQGYNPYPYHSQVGIEQEEAPDFMQDWKDFELSIVRDETKNTAIALCKILIKLELAPQQDLRRCTFFLQGHIVFSHFFPSL